MKRILLASALLVAVAAGVLAWRLRAPPPPPIAPTLSVVMATELDGGVRVALDSMVQLEVGLSAPAYVYLFDEVGGMATLSAPHEGEEPWPPGVYQSESEPMAVAGLHKLVLITSRKPRTEWRGVRASELLVNCEGCEAASVVVEVFGERPKQDFPKLNPNQDVTLTPGK